MSELGAQTVGHFSPQAWALIRAQGLVIPSGLGEQNESRYTIAPASAPTGCDSQLTAAGQTVHSWAPASGRGWHHQAYHHASPPCRSPSNGHTSLQTGPGLVLTLAALSVSKRGPSTIPASLQASQGHGSSKSRQPPLTRHRKTLAPIPSLLCLTVQPQAAAPSPHLSEPQFHQL